jgi:hypothetical protein
MAPGEKRKLLEQARALGMSLAPLRVLPVTEVRKRIEARVKQKRHGLPVLTRRGR